MTCWPRLATPRWLILEYKTVCKFSAHIMLYQHFMVRCTLPLGLAQTSQLSILGWLLYILYDWVQLTHVYTLWLSAIIFFFLKSTVVYWIKIYKYSSFPTCAIPPWGDSIHPTLLNWEMTRCPDLTKLWSFRAQPPILSLLLIPTANS